MLLRQFGDFQGDGNRAAVIGPKLGLAFSAAAWAECGVNRAFPAILIHSTLATAVLQEHQVPENKRRAGSTKAL